MSYKKFLIYLSVLFLISFPLVPAAYSALCTDNDGGLNFYTKGKLTYGLRTYTDYCVGSYIKEYYCKPNGFAGLWSYYCRGGCSYGKCNIYTPVCGDGYREYREYYEECDSGVNNGVACTPSYGTYCTYCSTSCTSTKVYGSYCGDGVVDSSYETCDDGNNANGDGCSSTCQVDYCTASADFGEQQQEIEGYCNTFTTSESCTSCIGSQTNCELCKWGSRNEYCRANGDFGSQQQEVETYCNTFTTKEICTLCDGSQYQCELCAWG